MTRTTLALAASALLLSAVPAVAATATISMVENEFKPATKTVAVGDTVTWRNDGTSAHEVTASAFKSGNVDPGKSYSWKAAKAGTYSYVCRYHESLGMKGTLVVKAAGSSTGLPDTGGDTLLLGLAVVGAASCMGLSLRYGWRTR